VYKQKIYIRQSYSRATAAAVHTISNAEMWTNFASHFLVDRVPWHPVPRTSSRDDSRDTPAISRAMERCKSNEIHACTVYFGPSRRLHPSEMDPNISHSWDRVGQYYVLKDWLRHHRLFGWAVLGCYAFSSAG
jgi:hypothetical protein